MEHTDFVDILTQLF